MDAAKKDIRAQTKDVLAEIDKLLADVGSDKSKLLRAQIFLVNLEDFAGMNAEWEAWLEGVKPPARATVLAPLVDPSWRVEIVIDAAV